MQSVVGDLSDAQRDSALYISKFVAACGVGLFDAALNFLWNETIRNLREKVARFDLNYFYDSAITNPKDRVRFKDQNDLVKLEDWALIKGCADTGIVSDIEPAPVSRTVGFLAHHAACVPAVYRRSCSTGL
jgi:hypothetical protein